MLHKSTLVILLILLMSCNHRRSRIEALIADSIIVAERSKAVVIDDVKLLKDDQGDSVVFLDYKRDGLIFPGKFKTYNEKTYEIGVLSVHEINGLSILEKSKNKHPQIEGDGYCTWSNYVKIEYMNDTLIVFGNKVLEITSKYSDLKLDTDTITLLLADDFTMKASDADGLTGCSDYSYLIVKSRKDEYSLIYSKELTDKKHSDIATLIHDDGMGETIESTLIAEDTLKLHIEINYQEGVGSYNLNIFKNSIWQYCETDRLREYE